MSWGEVFKINSNLKKPLNEQMRDITLLPMRVITSSITYTPEKTGIYKIICVGAGGEAETSTSSTSYKACGGAGGGVAIKTMRLESSKTYNITVGTTASFGTDLTATAGSSNDSGGVGGIGAGGDYNFEGKPGTVQAKATANMGAPGGSVGVHISGLSNRINTSLTRTFTVSGDLECYSVDFIYGEGLLNHGGGSPGTIFMGSNGSNKQPISQPVQSAAVIIIPLEMEE